MTRRALVVGWPVEHSRSPVIHTHWIKQHGLDATYGKWALDPAAAQSWFAQFAGHNLAGANVTVPHKEAAFAACANLTPGAERLGSVNTLWLEGNMLCGDSTDGAGFLQNLASTAPQWQSHPSSSLAMLLGAGGAARAIADALLAQGVERVAVLNRTLSRAETVANDLNTYHGAGRAVPLSLDRMQTTAGEAGLFVNTTSLGMVGEPPLNVDIGTLAEGATVADIVYAPLETTLLRVARDRGHPTVDGLGMLLHQAVPGFERWFGVRPTVTPELRDCVLADLAPRQA